MANVSFNNSPTGVNTDRVAASSKAFVKKNVENDSSGFQSPAQITHRPLPDDKNAPFVEVDGKRYYLNVPRGTYLNILV